MRDLAMDFWRYKAHKGRPETEWLKLGKKERSLVFHTGTFRRRSKGSYSLDDIRLRHGSHSVTGNRKIKSLV